MTRATTLWDHSAACGRGFIRFLRDKSGNVLVMTALTAPILLGMAGLGFDVISWYMLKRNAQTVVDNAALAATLELSRGGDATDAKNAALAHVAHSGFVDGTHGKVTVNVPPQAGPHAGDNMFVEVLVEQEGAHFLSAAMFNESATVQSRAVGGLYSGGNYCVVALEDSGSRTILTSGAATLELGACSLAANSDAGEAIKIDGGMLTADIVQAVGGINYDPTDMNLTYNPPREGAPPVPDPYDDLAVIPDPTTAMPPCLLTDHSVSGVETLNPGNYCGGLKINGTANVTFNSGVYFITNGHFEANGGSTVNGTDVTFIITGESSGDVHNFKITGDADITLSAPANGHHYGPYDGDYAGVLIYVDQRADNGSKNHFSGGTNMLLQGAIYAPTSQIVFSGGTDLEIGCLQVIGHKVEFTGNSHVTALREDCGGLGARVVGLDLPSLFE